MVTRKSMLVASLIGFCILGSLFDISPTKSQTSDDRYRPELDVYPDGIIDIFDITAIALAFGTTGKAYNYTEWISLVEGRVEVLEGNVTSLSERLDSINATNVMPLINSLQTEVDSLNASIAGVISNMSQLDERMGTAELSLLDLISRVGTLEDQMVTMDSRITQLESLYDTLNASVLAIDAKYAALISSLNTTITELNSTLSQQIDDLETQLAIMNATKLGMPDWNTSGWYGPLAFGDTVFNHDLNLNLTTTDVLVYMIGRKTLTGSIQQKDYGGWQQANGNWYGAYWYLLTENTITVHRHGNDGDWVYVRIFIWKIPK